MVKQKFVDYAKERGLPADTELTPPSKNGNAAEKLSLSSARRNSAGCDSIFKGRHLLFAGMRFNNQSLTNHRCTMEATVGDWVFFIEKKHFASNHYGVAFGALIDGERVSGFSVKSHPLQ
jgi:hypothetical protein